MHAGIGPVGGAWSTTVVKTTYEYAVIGCGGIGGAAAYWLSREAGDDVLALEQFRIGHDYGASQDHSRIIRLSYHAPEYTALTPHTYTAFAEVEAESGVQLVHVTGGLDIASGSHGAALDPYAAGMRAAGIPFEELGAAETMARFPQFRLAGDERVLFQESGGFVDARKSIATHLALARGRGATVLDELPVLRVRPDGRDGAMAIETKSGTFLASTVIVAADAWTNQVLAGLHADIPLTVTEEQVTYFATSNLRDFAPDRFPMWISHGPESFYGFPVYGEVATKAGLDVGGDITTPERRSFTPNPRPYAKLVAFLERTIPGFLGPVLYTKTCLYTMTPDRDFIVDTLPEHPSVIVLQGAAHGFKFSSLLGRAAAQLATTGATEYPIGAFGLARPALTDPAYGRAFAI